MHFRKLTTVTLMALLFLVGGLAAGCGGDDQQETPQDGAGGGTAEEQGGATGLEEQEGPGAKIAPGTIVSVNRNNGRFVLEPSRGEEMVFKTTQQVQIELDGEPAELVDMQKGQQAQVEYVVRENMAIPNRATSITLFTDAGGGATG